MMSEIIRIEAHAASNADSLGYMGQQAVAQAVDGDTPYRIIGGHMVRLLLHVYPTSNATLRSTIDADAAVDDIEIVGDIVDGLCAQDFSQTGGKRPEEGCELRAECRSQPAGLPPRKLERHPVGVCAPGSGRSIPFRNSDSPLTSRPSTWKYSRPCSTVRRSSTERGYQGLRLQSC